MKNLSGKTVIMIMETKSDNLVEVPCNYKKYEFESEQLLFIAIYLRN